MTILGSGCDETGGVGLSLSEMIEGMKICGKAAQFGVAALKNFQSIEGIDFAIN